MRRLSIPTRIFLAFVLMTLGFVTVAVISVQQHNRTSRDLRLLRDGYLPLAKLLIEAKSQQAVFRGQVARAMAGDAEAASWFRAAHQLRPSTLRRIEHHLARAERLAARVDRADGLVSVRDAFDDVRTDFDRLAVIYDELLARLDAGGEAGTVAEEVNTLEADVGTEIRESYTSLLGCINGISVSVTEQEEQSALVLGILTVVAFFLGIVMTFWSQRLLGPLPRLQERVATLGKGDLSPQEPISRRDDELGRLAIDFEAMVAALSARDERLDELRRLQQQIVDGLRAAVIVVDDSDKVRSVNRAAARVLALDGLDPGVTLKDAGVLNALPGLSDVVQQVRRGESGAILEAQELGGTSPLRYVDVVATPLGSDPDDPRVLIVADDVTEALETKSRLIDTERLAAIGRMAAHVTHEVRNPLSSIGLNVEMLEDELPDGAGEARALMQAIQKEIERLRVVTDEYLSLARVPDPRIEAEDAGDFLFSISNFVRREMETSGIELHLEVDEDLPRVGLDEAQMRQALLNILRNGREAGGSNLWVHARANRDGVEVSIEDDGVGISDDDQAHVFELFFTTKKSGTGLGLPLTLQIVNAHGGTVKCESADGGKGTRFVLWWPSYVEGTAVESKPLFL
ncbi:MAG: signal transduction histidine kinase [Polyangiales bacterium]